MATPTRFTKAKVIAGYLLLLAILFLSLWFIRHEMENLSLMDTEQVGKSDSLLSLMRQKDENTIQMLRALTKENEHLLSVDDIRQIIERQDTVITQQRVQQRVVEKRDSVIAQAPKRGFFKRISEVFAPSKDSVIQINSTIESTVDTLLNEYNPIDSIQQQLLQITEQKIQTYRRVSRNNARLREINQMLTGQIDSLVKTYEREVALQLEQEAEAQRMVRMRSTRTIAWIAVGAVILSVIFLIFIWRDITRSNRYRRELEEARKRAENLLQTRERLMLAITHDFKAPLGSIIGYIDLLSRLLEDDREKFYLTNMESSSKHLLKLVNDLLDFHRLDLNKVEIQRVSFQPMRLFDEIKVSFEPLAMEKGLALNYEVGPELKSKYISDPLRIRQVVTNLLSNAIKFTKKGSVSLQVSYRSSQMQMVISDTGSGMKPADRERIFQVFTRLPDAQGEEGFGVGLSIVHKLTELLEGTIRVDSVEGEGSSFTVSIPLYPVASEKEEITVGKEPETLLLPKDAALRVLLIDDDKIQLDLTTAMLSRQGIASVACEQLEELIECLRRETFDVLLTDVQMPAINGFDLLKLLRFSNIPQARSIPIIAVTARSEMSEEEFVKHGFAAKLSKPFSLRDLLQAIGKNISLQRSEKTTKTETGERIVNLKALTTFSEGDREAARSIMISFVEETRKNSRSLQLALEREDMNAIAGMAHKLLPLFTLLNAEFVPLLRELELLKDKELTSRTRESVEEVLAGIGKVLEMAEQEVQ